MAATIIYLVISLLVSLIFIILGIMQYRSEKPVSINTGEKPLRKEELTNVQNGTIDMAEILLFWVVCYLLHKLFLDILLKSWMALWFRWLFI